MAGGGGDPSFDSDDGRKNICSVLVFEDDIGSFLLALINVSAGRCSELCGVVVAISTLFLQHNKYECGVVSNLVSVSDVPSTKVIQV